MSFVGPSDSRRRSVVCQVFACGSIDRQVRSGARDDARVRLDSRAFQPLQYFGVGMKAEEFGRPRRRSNLKTIAPYPLGLIVCKLSRSP